METLLLMSLAIFLVLLNGFFVAAEFAIVKLRLTQAEELAQQKGYAGRILLSVRSHLDAYLSACQLGITLASLALGWIGEPAFAALLEPLLLAVGVASPEVIHGISLAVAFSIISFLHIVLGELAPKSLAIRKPETVSMWAATPLYLFYWAMYPFIWVLNASANLILRLMRVEISSGDEDAHSVGELRQILLASHRHGELDDKEADTLSRALDFSDLAVGDVMRPAPDLITLDIRASPEEQLAVIRRHRYSRYPVVDGDREHVLGVIHVKDLLMSRDASGSLDLRSLLRPILRLHRDAPALKLFEKFRSGAPHLALVDDHSSNIIGFVTLIHILEALHGRIQDEFQHQKDDWLAMPDGSFTGSGSLPIYSLERLLEIEVDAEDVDSVSGLLMLKLGHVPRPGEHADFEHFSVEVLKMRGTRIAKVKVSPRPAAEHTP